MLPNHSEPNERYVDLIERLRRQSDYALYARWNNAAIRDLADLSPAAPCPHCAEASARVTAAAQMLIAAAGLAAFGIILFVLSM